MSRPLKISVITATRNRRDLLERCIASVAAQGWESKEHVVIDGGSTDGTPQRLAELAARHPHLNWVSEPDQGMTWAFNKGLERAGGDVFVVVGDDDVVLPGALEAVAAAFAGAGGEIGLVSGHCRLVRNDGTFIRPLRAAFSSRADMIRFWKNWGRATMLPGPSTYFRRRVIETVGPFDTRWRYAMDYEHFIRITEKFGVVILDRDLANFRFDHGNLSYTQYRKQIAETFQISRLHWGPAGSMSWWSHLGSFVIDRIKRRFLWRIWEWMAGPFRSRPGASD